MYLNHFIHSFIQMLTIVMQCFLGYDKEYPTYQVLHYYFVVCHRKYSGQQNQNNSRMLWQRKDLYDDLAGRKWSLFGIVMLGCQCSSGYAWCLGVWPLSVEWTLSRMRKPWMWCASFLTKWGTIQKPVVCHSRMEGYHWGIPVGRLHLLDELAGVVFCKIHLHNCLIHCQVSFSEFSCSYCTLTLLVAPGLFHFLF